MSTRFIIRSFLSLSASLAIAIWPSISKADTVLAGGVYTWGDAEPGVFVASLQYPIESGTPTAAQLAAFPGAKSWNAAAAAAGVPPGQFIPLTQPTYLGTADLTNTIVIAQGANAADAAAAYANLYYMNQSAYNGNGIVGDPNGVSTWTGKGITSSSAAAEQASGIPLTGIALGINDGQGENAGVQNNDSSFTTFDGVNVNTNSVIMMYTYYGDTTFKGTVSLDDVNNVITGYELDTVSGIPGFAGSVNGDFSYTGGAQLADVNNVITDFELQGIQGLDLDPPLQPVSNPTQPDVSFGADPVSVPEPSAVALGLIGAIGLLAGFRFHRREAVVGA